MCYIGATPVVISCHTNVAQLGGSTMFMFQEQTGTVPQGSNFTASSSKGSIRSQSPMLQGSDQPNIFSFVFRLCS